jgi:carbamoyl-phosphate synthase large subunit
LLPVELVAVSAARDRVGARVFIPRHETLEVCEDKLASQQVWQRAGLPVPATMLIEDEADLRQAFQDFGPKLWLRAIRGAGGRDSLPVEDYETALAWMRLKDGWGTSTAAECLESSTITWQSIWKNGELVVAQARTRLYWEFTTVPLSGVTGVTGTGQTVSDPAADEIAMAAVKAVDPRPDGLFGVDLTYDRRGVPNLTEINCGRFFTTHHFFAAAGLNMAHIMIKAAFDEPIPELPRKINPLPPGLLWVRGMDRKPILSDWETVNRYEAELAARRQALSRTRAGR